jgi:hypothetical protein
MSLNKKYRIKRLPKYQSKGEVLQNKVLTYKDNPQYFDNDAVLGDDIRYSDLVKKRVYAGTHGYNPATGRMVKLDSPQRGADGLNLAMSKRPEDRTSDDKSYIRRNQVFQDLKNKTYKNPLFYAPAAVATIGAFGPAAMTAMSNPLVSGPLSAYGVYDATTNSIPSAVTATKEGRYLDAAGNAGMAALDLLPLPFFGTNLIDEGRQFGKAVASKFKPSNIAFTPSDKPIMTTDVQSSVNKMYPGYNFSELGDLSKKDKDLLSQNNPPVDKIIEYNPEMEKLQSEIITESRRFAENWALKDREEYFEISSMMDNLREKIRKLEKKEPIHEDIDFEIGPNEKQAAEIDNWVRNIKPQIDSYRKNLNDLWNRREFLMDPDYKQKIEAIKTANPKTNDVEKYRLQSEIKSSLYKEMRPKSHTLIQDLDDPNISKLSERSQDYLKKNYGDMGGFANFQDIVSLGSRPKNTRYAAVPDMPFDIKDPSTWSTLIGKPKLDYSKGRILNVNERQYYDPERMRHVAVHEEGHPLQKTYGFWADELTERDTGIYNYTINRGDSEMAKEIKDAMVDPTPKDQSGRHTTETWRASYKELHSELMSARDRKTREYQKLYNLTERESIDMLKHQERRGDNDLFKWYLTEGNLDKHFKRKGVTNRALFNKFTQGEIDYDTYRKMEDASVTPYELKKKILQAAPALVPGLFAAGAATNTEKQQGGEMFNTYRNYINGVDESSNAKKVYDKMNTQFYTKSKQAGMSPSNFIMTYVIPA